MATSLRLLMTLAVVCATMVIGLVPPAYLAWLKGDMLNHAFAFLVVTLLIRGLWPAIAGSALLAIAAVFGATIEVAQFVAQTGHKVQVTDWLADMAGAVIALVLIGLLDARRQ